MLAMAAFRLILCILKIPCATFSKSEEDKELVGNINI